MFRKTLLIAIPAMALMLALGTDNSASQAFAKGGSGKGSSKGMSKDHRGRDWNFRRYGRYGWGYGFGYGCFEPVVEMPVAPVCPTCEAPAAPVAPAVAVPTCTVCEPVVSVVPEYSSYWGKYGKFHDFRHHRERPLSHGSRGGRK